MDTNLLSDAQETLLRHITGAADKIAHENPPLSPDGILALAEAFALVSGSGQPHEHGAPAPD